METLLKLMTAENFAMIIALYLLVKTTGAIEKTTKSLDVLASCLNKTCTEVSEFTEKISKVIDTWEKRMWVYDMHIEQAKRKKEDENEETGNNKRG